MVLRFATSFNGISIAYVMALVNSLLAVLLAFGVNMNTQQQAAVVALVNACLALMAHVSHRNGEVHQAATDSVPPPVPVPPPLAGS